MSGAGPSGQIPAYRPRRRRLQRAAPQDEVLLHKLQRQLEMELEGSTLFWRRVTQAQSLWALACFISTGLAQGQFLHELMAPLLAAMSY